jgi:hypothetical protein
MQQEIPLIGNPKPRKLRKPCGTHTGYIERASLEFS